MEITDIKKNLTIEAVLTHYHQKADRSGRMKCPFHEDVTPSMMVYPKTNTVYCHTPSCKCGNKVIDQIDFIMYIEGISKHEALKKATELAQHYAPNHKAMEQKQRTMTVKPTPQPEQNLDKLLHSLRQRFYRGSVARDYAKSRYLDEKKLELGFNPYHNKEYKQLQNCLIFPLKDIDDKVVSLYGRSVSKNPHSKHFYLKGRRGLYPGYPPVGGQDPSDKTKTLIIAEAIVDAATLQSHGVNKNASILALYGSNGWTEEHTEAIRRWAKPLSSTEQFTTDKEVVFFMDGDAAGQGVIETYSGIIKAIAPGCVISKVDTPQGEDINSLLETHSSEILDHLIDQRITIHGSRSKEETFLFLPAEAAVKAGSFESHPTNEKLEQEKQAAETEKPTTGSETVQAMYEIPPLNLEQPEYIRWERHGLSFTVIGGLSIYPVDRMLITLGIKKVGSHRPLHSLRQKVNLYQDDFVEKMARKVAERMEMGTTKVHEALLELTGLLEEYRQDEIKKMLGKEQSKRALSPSRVKELEKFLKAPNLNKRTSEMIGQTGLVGELVNRMILWYVYGYRKSNHPLHVMCLGASGTGKTYLQEKIGGLMPEEEKKEITSMSNNAVYYFEEDELVHKILILEDLDGANEQNLLYALRELMSKTSVTKDVVIKDNKGKLKTISITVKGPVCITGTTTRESLYADNADRTIMIYLDTSPEQVQAVLSYLRKKNAGKINKYEQEKTALFLQDIQRILKPIDIIIPYAEDLILPTWFLKQYRTNSHYQEFIKAVSFYHQYQRPIKYDERRNPYIESTYEDIEIANRLMKDVLLAKSDELTKATRGFYDLILKYLTETDQESFRTSEVRMRYRISPATIGRHIKKLTKYGYIKIVSGNKRTGYEYEIEQNIEDRRGRLGTILDEILEKIKKKYGKPNQKESSLKAVSI